MVTRTCLSVTLYVHCVSCLNVKWEDIQSVGKVTWNWIQPVKHRVSRNLPHSVYSNVGDERFCNRFNGLEQSQPDFKERIVKNISQLFADFQDSHNEQSFPTHLIVLYSRQRHFVPRHCLTSADTSAGLWVYTRIGYLLIMCVKC